MAKDKKVSIADLLDLIEKRTFDPEIEVNLPKFEREISNFNHISLPNQYIYYWNFYNKTITHHKSNNIESIIGFSKDEITFDLMYKNIHPADRLIVYLATIKSVYYADSRFKNRPFENVFVMDFRFKCKNGAYIRIMRETGCAINDKIGNMVYSFAIHTDISEIKTNNRIGLLYRGNSKEVCFPDDDLLTTNNVFGKREKQILYYLAKGKLSKEIAEILHISKHTVDTHRRNMLCKAMLKNTPELILYGIDNGLI